MVTLEMPLTGAAAPPSPRPENNRRNQLPWPLRLSARAVYRRPDRRRSASGVPGRPSEEDSFSFLILLSEVSGSSDVFGFGAFSPRQC